MLYTYEEAVQYILEVPKFSTKNGLDHTKSLLSKLHQPQESLKVIHIAGTNGKGSVCLTLDTILRAQGKRVGRFTSPHLERINERFVVDGQMITDDTFVCAFHKVLDATRAMEAEGASHPTFFEFVFAMACVIFCDSGVEYAVMETGLGGRLDATNSISNPILTGITSIGWDHSEILGDTIEKIAAEKAGIIKADIPVFFQQTQDASDEVMRTTAQEKCSPCYEISESDYQILTHDYSGIHFIYSSKMWRITNPGLYQVKNTVMAIQMCYHLFGEESKIQAWNTAIAQQSIPGRMEEVLPNFFLDGAHNTSAIECFINTVNQIQQVEAPIILFSAVRDKDYKEMIRLLCEGLPLDTTYILTEIPGERCLTVEEIAEEFRKHTNAPILQYHSIVAAIKKASAIQKKKSVICIGSLYLIGHIKAYIHTHNM